ncbi:MAG: ribonuclease D [Thermoanaerobaculia bacterium]|nr:ribonuclease D [Thermoanaerobaculia bacterium]
MNPTLVTDPHELGRLCRRWEQQERLCLDTEFVRTRTFYAHLGLIQVADERGVYLVDAVAIDDLAPFAAVLASPRSRKVLHSCGEDLGVFQHRFGRLPRGLFDTQVAAALVGLGFSLSYQGLVSSLLGIHVEKEETRSNWTARPLREAQLGYAASDVAHLGELHAHLAGRLAELGREAWAEEEFARVLEKSRHAVPPHQAFRRVKGHGSLDRRGQAILRGLCAWREDEARRRDLARGFVVRDPVLLAVARARPRSRRDLRDVRELGSRDRRRYGDALLAIVDEAMALDGSDLPERRAPSRRVPRLAERVRELQELVAEIGDSLQIAPEVLAQRRVLESLVRSYFGKGSRDLPEELEGWRRAVVGEPALARLDAMS